MKFLTTRSVSFQPDNRDTTYEGDYRALTELQKWTGEAGLGALILHHTRKMESEDPIDSVSGTFGLAGCVDTVAVLARTGKGTTLYIRGRDVEEQEKAISFNKSNCRWTILGEAEEVHRSDIRQKIVTFMGDVTKCHEAVSPKDLADICDTNEPHARKTLGRMVNDGEIIKVSRGRYVSAKRDDLVSLYRRPKRHIHK